ncbi:MAG: hypothetical protein WC156_06290, partial [Pedobacter sp.]
MSSRKAKKKNKFKVRTLSQRIGALGESLIPTWAIDNNLSATKISSEDFGLDFILSVFEKEKAYEIFKGKTVAVQCKSSVDLPGYVKIEPADANLYLRSTSPVFILAVDTTSRTIMHKFVDENLIARLTDFLESDNDSLNLNVQTEFESDNKIAENIYSATLTFKSTQLQLSRKNALIKIDHPNVRSELVVNSKHSTLKLCTHLGTDIFVPEAIFSDGFRNENPTGIFRNSFSKIINEISDGCDIISIFSHVGKDLKITAFDAASSISIEAIKYIDGQNLCFRFKSGFCLIAGPCNPYGLTRPARSAQSNVQEARPIGMEFYIWVMVRYLSGVNR